MFWSNSWFDAVYVLIILPANPAGGVSGAWAGTPEQHMSNQPIRRSRRVQLSTWRRSNADCLPAGSANQSPQAHKHQQSLNVKKKNDNWNGSIKVREFRFAKDHFQTHPRLSAAMETACAMETVCRILISDERFIDYDAPAWFHSFELFCF